MQAHLPGSQLSVTWTSICQTDQKTLFHLPTFVVPHHFFWMLVAPVQEEQTDFRWSHLWDRVLENRERELTKPAFCQFSLYFSLGWHAERVMQMLTLASNPSDTGAMCFPHFSVGWIEFTYNLWCIDISGMQCATILVLVPSLISRTSCRCPAFSRSFPFIKLAGLSWSSHVMVWWKPPPKVMDMTILVMNGVILSYTCSWHLFLTPISLHLLTKEMAPIYTYLHLFNSTTGTYLTPMSLHFLMRQVALYFKFCMQ